MRRFTWSEIGLMLTARTSGESTKVVAILRTPTATLKNCFYIVYMDYVGRMIRPIRIVHEPRGTEKVN